MNGRGDKFIDRKQFFLSKNFLSRGLSMKFVHLENVLYTDTENYWSNVYNINGYSKKILTAVLLILRMMSANMIIRVNLLFIFIMPI